MSDYIITGKAVERWDLPTAIMAQEIVRCRDCEHYDPHCTDDGVCFLPDGNGDFARWEVKPDGFCAWAERKSE